MKYQNKSFQVGGYGKDFSNNWEKSFGKSSLKTIYVGSDGEKQEVLSEDDMRKILFENESLDQIGNEIININGKVFKRFDVNNG